jgi:tRNA pseudouridine38-40 synthase
MGNIEPEAIDAMLASRDRRAAGPTAPACGLYLQWIVYGAGIGGGESEDADEEA